MERSRFENLRIYKLSEELADHIWEIVLKWDHFPRSTVGIQLVKAADSIGANIAEGTGRGSRKENRRFALIARGSLYEVRHWLRRACRRNLLSREEIGLLEKIVNDLTPRLGAYIKTLKTEPKTNASRNNKQQATDNILS